MAAEQPASNQQTTNHHKLELQSKCHVNNQWTEHMTVSDSTVKSVDFLEPSEFCHRWDISESRAPGIKPYWKSVKTQWNPWRLNILYIYTLYIEYFYIMFWNFLSPVSIRRQGAQISNNTAGPRTVPGGRAVPGCPGLSVPSCPFQAVRVCCVVRCIHSTRRPGGYSTFEEGSVLLQSDDGWISKNPLQELFVLQDTISTLQNISTINKW